MATSPSADMDTARRDANDSLPHYQDTNLYVVYTIKRHMRIIVPVTCGLIFIIGSIGNLLVILAVSLYKKMRTKTNIFILSLAVADLLFIIVILPFKAIDFAINDDWPFGTVWCKISGYVSKVTFYASVYTLLGVTFNRFLAVVFPISSMRLRTRSNAIRTVLVLWVVILLANIPIIFINNIIQGKDNTFCGLADSTLEPLVYGAWFLFGFAIPFALMCILYGLIAGHLLRRTVRGISRHGGNSQVQTRAIRMCVVVVSVFTVCWFPFHAWSMWRLYGKQIEHEEIIAFYTFGYASIALAYINSCLNPILYAFLSEEFRSSFKKIMRCYSIRKS